MSSPVVRAHKDYQEFVKEQLTLRKIDIPFVFQDVFIKLYELDLSPLSFILKDRYSHHGSPARDPQDMLRSLLAMTLLGITGVDPIVRTRKWLP